MDREAHAREGEHAELTRAHDTATVRGRGTHFTLALAVPVVWRGGEGQCRHLGPHLSSASTRRRPRGTAHLDMSFDVIERDVQHPWFSVGTPTPATRAALKATTHTPAAHGVDSSRMGCAAAPGV